MPHTLDWVVLPWLGIPVLLIYVFHAQQRCYGLFSLPCSEMEGGKKKKQRKKMNQRVFSSQSTTEHQLQEYSSNDERVGRGPSLPGVPPFSLPLKDHFYSLVLASDIPFFSVTIFLTRCFLCLILSGEDISQNK